MAKIKRKVGKEHCVCYVILSPLAGGLTHDLMGVVLPHSVEVPCMKWEGATKGSSLRLHGYEAPVVLQVVYRLDVRQMQTGLRHGRGQVVRGARPGLWVLLHDSLYVCCRAHVSYAVDACKTLGP